MLFSYICRPIKEIRRFNLKCIAMDSDKRHHHKKHVDESEIWKQKTLTSAENRKKFARWTNILLGIVACLIIAACAFAYFVDR